MIIHFIFVSILGLCQESKIQLFKPSYKQIDSIESFSSYKNLLLDSTIIADADKVELKISNTYANKKFGNVSSSIETSTNYIYSTIDSSVNLILYSWEGHGEVGRDLIFNQLEKNKKKFKKYFKDAGKADYNDAFMDGWAGNITVWINKDVTVKQWFYLTNENKIGIKLFIHWKSNYR